VIGGFDQGPRGSCNNEIWKMPGVSQYFLLQGIATILDKINVKTVKYDKAD